MRRLARSRRWRPSRICCEPPADEDKFEELATTVPLRVDPVTGSARAARPARLYQYVEDSPDGQYLLVYRLQRPFSFRVPDGLFARRTEVWTARASRCGSSPTCRSATRCR